MQTQDHSVNPFSSVKSFSLVLLGPYSTNNGLSLKSDFTKSSLDRQFLYHYYLCPSVTLVNILLWAYSLILPVKRKIGIVGYENG